MMKLKCLFLTVLTAAIGMSVLTSNISAETKNSADMKSVVEGNTTFALNLYSKLKDAEGNLFFSPYSISTALAMTYAGARGNTEKLKSESRFTGNYGY